MNVSVKFFVVSPIASEASAMDYISFSGEDMLRAIHEVEAKSNAVLDGFSQILSIRISALW